MLYGKMHHFFLLLLCACILTLTAACGTSPGSNQSTGNMSSSPTTNHASLTNVPASLSATAQAAGQAISTDCPATGRGRMAVMPALALGKQRTVVFFANVPFYTGHPSLALKRYNVETRATTTILSENNQNIQNAQISGDGQWILLVVQTANNSELQLIRVDGKYLQTLYCAPQDQQIDPLSGAENGYSHGVQWSPDQKLIIFTQGKRRRSRPHPRSTC